MECCNLSCASQRELPFYLKQSMILHHHKIIILQTFEALLPRALVLLPIRDNYTKFVFETTYYLVNAEHPPK